MEYDIIRAVFAGRLVIILKGRHNAKTISSWCTLLWVHYADFVPASRFLSGIPVASAKCVAGMFSFLMTPFCRISNEQDKNE